jgi:hypothetical protein
MATLFEFVLQDYLEIFVIFIFLYAFMFGILKKIKIFGEDSNNLNALIAFGVSLLFVISPNLRQVLSVSLPWYAFIFIITALIIMVFMIGGASDADVGKIFTDRKYAGTVAFVVIVIFVIIFWSSVMNVYGDDLRTAGGNSNTATNYTYSEYEDVEIEPIPDAAYADNTLLILAHPKVLGTILLLVFAGALVFFMGDNGKSLK